MDLLILLCDSMTGVCKASGLKQSMAFRLFAWFLVVFFCIDCQPCCTSFVLPVVVVQQQCMLLQQVGFTNCVPHCACAPQGGVFGYQGIILGLKEPISNVHIHKKKTAF